MKIVSQVNADEHPSRGRVDTHVVSGVVKVLCARVSLDVVGVVVSPAELYVDPVLLSCGAIHDVTTKEKQASVLNTNLTATFTPHADSLIDRQNRKGHKCIKTVLQNFLCINRIFNKRSVLIEQKI